MSIYLRTYQGVSRHFRSRMPEWILGIGLANWGLYVILHADGVGGMAAFQDLAQRWPMKVWGVAALLVGLARVGSLIINGSFVDTPLFKYAPYGRMATAFLSMFFWLQLFLSILKADMPAPGLVWYPLFLAVDLWNVYHTAGEAKVYKEVRNGIGTSVG